MTLSKPARSQYKDVRGISLVRNIKNRYQNQTHIFLACFLASFLTCWTHFCLIDWINLMDLVIDLIIGGMMSIAGRVTAIMVLRWLYL